MLDQELKITECPSMDVSAKQWADWQIRFNGDPWTLLKDNIAALYSEPSGDVAITKIVEWGRQISRCANTEEIAAQLEMELNELYSVVIHFAKAKIDAVAFHERRGHKIPAGYRWADIGRGLLLPLRAIATEEAMQLVQEILTSNTMPDVQAQWVDQMTGEIDEEIMDDFLTHVKSTDMGDLATEGFNDEDDSFEGFEFGADDHRLLKPEWSEIYAEENFHERNMEDLFKAVKPYRKEVAKQFHAIQGWKMSAGEKKEALLKSRAFDEIAAFCMEMLEEGYEPEDLRLAWEPLTRYGITIQDAPDDIQPLSTQQPLMARLDAEQDKLLADMVRVAAEEASFDIHKSPEFVEGFLRSMFAGGKNPNGAGWDSWNKNASPEKKAEFKEEYRKAHAPTIVGMNSKGLMLSSKRFVDWHIAALKLKNDELKVNRKSLKDTLRQNGFGTQEVFDAL